MEIVFGGYDMTSAILPMSIPVCPVGHVRRELRPDLPVGALGQIVVEHGEISGPPRPFVRRAGMRIASQGILGTRIGTPSRPGWSTSGLSRSLEAGGPSDGRPVQSPRPRMSSGGGGAARRDGEWCCRNYPETSPARWHDLVSAAGYVTSI